MSWELHATEDRSPGRAAIHYRNETSRDPGYYNQSRDWQSRDLQSQSYQWREKRTSQPSARPGNSESSRTRRSPLERNVEQPISSPAQANLYPTVPTTEETMGALREVTVQYVSCADPTESAARKQRVMQGESRGLMAETAANIIAAATNFSAQLNLPTTNLPIEELEPPRDSQVAVIPQDPTPEAPAKKKRGRPPVNRLLNKSPLKIFGVKTQKRNLVQAQGSPTRKPPLGKTNLPRRENSGNSSRAWSSRRTVPHVEENISPGRRQGPKIALIPASKKGLVDFQNPPNPLP